MGGETWITESKTTVFHNFWKTKALTPSESIEDFREVTASEKAQLEKIRDEWVRPPQMLIDYININFSDYGRYNENTGYFELNTITDLTTEDFMRIISTVPNANDLSEVLTRGQRTNLPFYRNWTGRKITRFAQGNKKVEVINLAGVLQVSDCTQAFYECSNLRKVYGISSMYAAQNTDSMFSGCTSLEVCEIKDIRGNMRWHHSNRLSYASLDFMQKYSGNTTATKTWTVHPSVYAALTGDAESYPFNGGTQEQWMQLLEDAAAKQITFASA